MRRAIEKKTRTSTAIEYEQGDKVFFKRKNNKRPTLSLTHPASIVIAPP